MHLKYSISTILIFLGSLTLGSTSSASTLEFDKKFFAPDGSDLDQFGRSVALDNGIALISGGLGFERDQGASVYQFDTNTGNLLRQYTAPDGVTANDFGNGNVAIAAENSIALIGASGDRENDIASGSAYFFDTETGDLIQKILAPDGARDDRFGWSVAINDGIALIGAPNFFGGGGSAYLFDLASGNFLHKLTAPNAFINQQFGWSVDIDKGLAIVGTFNINDDLEDWVYLFDTETGNLIQQILAPEGSSEFGFSVSIENGIALIGAPNFFGGSGSAYLFDAETGNLLQELLPPIDSSELFGTSVTLDNGYALIGSLGLRTGERDAAFLFNVETGDFLQELRAPDLTTNAFFGISVALEENMALIGASETNEQGNASGSAYLFRDIPSIPEPSSLIAIIVATAFGVTTTQRKY